MIGSIMIIFLLCLQQINAAHIISKEKYSTEQINIQLNNQLMSEELLILKEHQIKKVGDTYKRQVTQSLMGNLPGSLFIYTGLIQFGTPAAPFMFLFDSGSTKTWIKDIDCDGCNGTYITKASRTFVLSNSETSSIAYVDGSSVSGPLAQDTVLLHGLTVQKFEFGLIRSIKDPSSTMNAYQGIAGFGPTSQQSASLFLSIFKKHPNLAPVISYFIDNSLTNGGITVGGIDIARFSGPLAVQEISPSSDGEDNGFSLPLDSIKVGENSVPLDAVKDVLIDTGTSLTILPMSVAEKIHEQLNFVPLKEDLPGLFGRLCPNSIIPKGLPNITITMGRVKLKITPDIYTFFIVDQGDTYCVSGIQGSTKDTSIIGNVFLRRYYTVFDLKHKRVGFATCNRASEVKSSIVNSNLNEKVVGKADPNSVFGETSSESSFGVKVYFSIEGLIILIIALMF